MDYSKAEGRGPKAKEKPGSAGEVRSSKFEVRATFYRPASAYGLRPTAFRFSIASASGESGQIGSGVAV